MRATARLAEIGIAAGFFVETKRAGLSCPDSAPALSRIFATRNSATSVRDRHAAAEAPGGRDDGASGAGDGAAEAGSRAQVAPTPKWQPS